MRKYKPCIGGQQAWILSISDNSKALSTEPKNNLLAVSYLNQSVKIYNLLTNQLFHELTALGHEVPNSYPYFT